MTNLNSHLKRQHMILQISKNSQQMQKVKENTRKNSKNKDYSNEPIEGSSGINVVSYKVYNLCICVVYLNSFVALIYLEQPWAFCGALYIYDKMKTHLLINYYFILKTSFGNETDDIGITDTLSEAPTEELSTTSSLSQVMSSSMK